jgi:lysophospholipase L1-like esterase
MKSAKKLGIALGATLITVLAAEVAARAAFPAPSGYYIYPPGLDQTFRPHPDIMPGVGPEARFCVNALGYRADELPEGESHRILALGGSTTECAFVDQAASWPQLVQDRLNAAAGEPAVWVANAGRSGFTSRRHVRQLRQILSQEPRFDTVLLLVGVNDLCNRLEYGADEPPEEALSPDGVPIERCFSVVPPEVDRDRPFLKTTGIWRALKSLKATLPDPKAQDLDGKKYVRWRRNRRQASEILPELPDLTRALAAYRANLAECVAIARAAGVRLVLVTQPSAWRADMPPGARNFMWLGGVGDYMVERGQPYYSIEALAEGMARYNAVLLSLAEELDVESIDLAPALPKSGASFYDDVHFNDAGSKRVAEVIAAYLLEHPPLTPGGH